MNLPVVLHVGFPRTATTWLQDGLAQGDRQILFLGRFTRPGLRWVDAELDVLWEWIRWGREDSAPISGMDLVERIVAERGGSEGMQSVVLSDETLAKPHRAGGHQKLAERLARAFPEAEVLLSLRNQVDLLRSLYGRNRKRLLGGGEAPQPMGEWVLDGAGSSYVPVADRFDFWSFYEPLAREFGPERIHFAFYEDLAGSPEAYLQDLARVFRVEKVPFNLEKRVNASAPPRSAEEKALVLAGANPAFRVLAQRAPRLWHRLGALLWGPVDWSRYEMTDRARFVLGALFRQSNDLLEGAAGIDLSGRGYPTSRTLGGLSSYFREE